MTTLFRQFGEVADYTSASAISSNAVVRIGLMQCGVAQVAIAVNATGSVGLDGVYELPKHSAAVLAQGAHVWWDPSASEVIVAPVTGSLFLGYAFSASASSATTVAVSLEEFDAEPPRPESRRDG